VTEHYYKVFSPSQSVSISRKYHCTAVCCVKQFPYGLNNSWLQTQPEYKYSDGQ